MAKKILVIDDEELIVRTLSNLLERNGYEVLVVKDGKDALAMVEEEDFDIIISDIRMPGQDGVQTIRAIEKVMQIQQKQRPPVIFMTGFSDKAIEKEAKSLKNVTFLYKPFETEEILRVIKRGG